MWSLETIARVQAPVVILENVVGMEGNDGNSLESAGTPLDLIKTSLTEAGYCTACVLIDLGTFHDVTRRRPAMHACLPAHT
eukprot:3988644-Amphidinium_carterae.2